MDKEVGESVLLNFADILDLSGIPFFLIQGTALGAYRDRGFTPTEQDIDIGVLFEDFSQDKLMNLFSTLLVFDYEIQTFHSPFTRTRLLTAKKYGCRIDIAAYMKWEGKRFATRAKDNRNLPEFSIVHDASMFEECIWIKMFGRIFNVPYPIEEYLELTYGKDWRTPNENHALMESSVCIRNFVKDNNIPLDLLERL